MSETRSVAVVIPAWNSLGLLPRCLASLRDQGVEIELLVVDNGSADGSTEYLRDNGVAHIALPRNLGFAAAVNLGVAETGAETIFVLNADTVVERGCIGLLLDALEAEQSLGGVQPRILQLERGEEPGERLKTARLYSAGQALTADGRAVELGAGEPQGPEYLTRREVFGVCGAACLLRREAFTDLGGYDERYFAFYEDVDLNVRARVAGWCFEYVPEALVWHLGNTSWQSGFRRPAAENARMVARNRLATQIKFMPLGRAPRIAAVEAGSLARAARQRRFLATLRGKLAALRWLPGLAAERRRLRREGDADAALRWLGVEARPGQKDRS